MTSNDSTTQYIANYVKELGGFNKVLDKVKIINASDGRCTAELLISEEHCNQFGTLHGGYSATLVDGITTCALLTHQSCHKIPSVSVDMHITYIKAACIGEEIMIDASTVRVGKTLSYMNCEIKKKSTGEVLVQGSHTKFLMRPK